MLTRFSDFRDWPFGRATGFRTFDAFDLLRRFDRLLADVEPDPFETRPTFPRVSLDDEGKSYVVRAEVPGLSEKDVELTATANTLTLRGERNVEAPEGYSTHRSERRSYKFARTFDLPAKIDADRVEARLENGMLKVTLPKAPEAQPKQISVKAS